MKKLVLALTVMALCSVNFASGPHVREVNPEREVAAAPARYTVAPPAALATSICSFNFTS